MIKYIVFSCILMINGSVYSSNATKAPKTAVPGVTEAEIKRLADKLESEMKARATASTNAQSVAAAATSNATGSNNTHKPKIMQRVYCLDCDHNHVYYL